MDGPYRTGARSSSTLETSRHGNDLSTRRGGATSPSAISSSSSDSGGGAPLSAVMSSLNIDSVSTSVRYTPPHLRIPRDQERMRHAMQEAATMRALSRFQVGHAPDDEDVFSQAGEVRDVAQARSEATLDRATSRSELQSEVPDRSGIYYGSDNASRFAAPDELRPGNRDTQHAVVPDLTSTNLHGRFLAQDDTLATPEPLGSGAMVRSASAYMQSPSYPLTSRSTYSESARHQVGGVDAQAFYPPNACVFVANLPESVDDLRLEAEVTRQFSDFGTVFVKIRRDARNMPFAFCQYTGAADAKIALTEGKGRMIYGRNCRTEPVRANRTYIMYRANGDDLDVEEARQTLADLGFTAFDRLDQLPAHIQAEQGMSRSVLVKLKNFDPSKELPAAFRHHHRYRVNPYDEQKGSQVSKPDVAEVWLQRYEVNRRSIFIGDLPYGVGDLEAQLRDVLGEIGDVVNVTIVSRDPQNGRLPNVFAFVEFARPDMAAIAVERLRNRPLFGRNVRIERKASRDSSTRQLTRLPSSAKDRYQSPRYNHALGYEGYGIGSPETPLRTANTLQQPAVNTPSPYGGRDWSSPVNYTTSPYHSPYTTTPYYPGYHATTPQMAPTLGSTTTPFGTYPASWMSPYLADPNLAALVQAYNQTQSGDIQAGGTGAEDDIYNTPTRNLDRGARGARREDDDYKNDDA
ncbi:putative RRM domain-containing protein [Seiridium cardinale]|uniref:RRM domain-containing protein n=1 Tax=Seiridium cardinale TaxID=138064 RepID=A0ABR2XU52_9PEZI